MKYLLKKLITRTAIVLVLTLGWQGTPLLASTNKVPSSSKSSIEDVVALAEVGKMDDALNLIKKRYKKEPDNADLYIIHGKILESAGDYYQAEIIWSRGLRGNENDIGLLMTIGEYRLNRFSMGPNMRIVGNMKEYSPNVSVNQDAYNREHLEEAATAFRRVVEMNPGITQAQFGFCYVAEKAGDWDALLSRARYAASICSAAPGFPLFQAKALYQKKQYMEALDAVETAIAMGPRLAEAYSTQADIYKAMGDARVEESLQRGRFYRWVPPFIDIPYTEENYQIADGLAQFAFLEKQEPEPDSERAVYESAKKCTEQLIKENTPLSSRFLAALCYSHTLCGKVEDRSFDALAERKEESLLHDLLTKGTSLCTYRQSAENLARMNSDKAFPYILSLLKKDTNIISMNIPFALAIYKRPEAIPELINAIKTKSDGDIMAALGMERRKKNAILALGSFQDKTAQKTLVSVAKDKNFKLLANAALYQMTRDEKYWLAIQRILPAARRGDLLAASIHFGEHALPHADIVQKAYQHLVDMENIMKKDVYIQKDKEKDNE